MRVTVDLLRLDCPDHARAWSVYISTGKAAEVMRVLRDDRDRLALHIQEYERKLEHANRAIAALEENE
jgi:hypothetical protein